MKTTFSPKGNVGLVVLVIVLSVVILGGAMGGAIYYQNQKSNSKNQNDISKLKNKETETVTTTGDSSAKNTTETETIDVTADPTVSWKIYTDKEYGFSFKYPIGWLVDKEYDADYPDMYMLSINGATALPAVNTNLFLIATQSYNYVPIDLGNEASCDLLIEKQAKFGQKNVSKGIYLCNDNTGANTMKAIYNNYPASGPMNYLSQGITTDGDKGLAILDLILSTFKTTDWEEVILNRLKDINSSPSISYQIPETWVAKEIIYDNAGSRADYSSGDKIILSVYNQDVPSTFGTSKLGISNIQDQTINNLKVKFWEYNNKKYYSFPTDDKDQYSFKFEFANTVESKTIIDILNLTNF